MLGGAERGKAIIKEPGGKDALSSYLQSTLTYPMAPWKPVTVQSKHTGEAYHPPALPVEVDNVQVWFAGSATTATRR